MNKNIEYKILIIEDLPEDMESIKRFLLKPGEVKYHFLEAETGEKGLDVLKDCKPDCIILDYMLPDVDGLILAKQITDDLSSDHIPIIILTGRGSEDIASRSIKIGIKDYIIKDNMDCETLNRSVRYAIDQAQSDLAFRDSERRFRTLVSNIPGAVYRCAADSNWTMEFLSDPIKEITGYPVSDFINNNVRSYVSLIYPDDRKKVEQQTSIGISSKEPFIIEYRIIDSNGDIRFVHKKAQGIYDDHGKHLWLDGVIFDISKRKHIESQREKLIKDLEKALATIKTLKGLIPICAGCKKIRDDKGFWSSVENYIRERTDAQFTHSMCPECNEKYYPEIYKK